MSADAVVSRELRSLQDELSTMQRERSATPPPAGAPGSGSAEAAKDTAGERELREQLNRLIEELTGFFEEAEKNIAAHPAQSVVIALAVGILIGRLLGRR